MANELIEAIIVGALALVVLILVESRFGVIYFAIGGIIMVVIYAIFLKYLTKEKKQVTVQQKFIQQTQQSIQKMPVKPAVLERKAVAIARQPMFPKVEKPSVTTRKTEL